MFCLANFELKLKKKTHQGQLLDKIFFDFSYDLKSNIESIS